MTTQPNEQWEQLRAKISDALSTRGEPATRLDAVLLAVEPFVMSGHGGYSADEGSFTLTWRQLRERERAELSELHGWRLLAQNLDRCEHGRHEGDPCAGESGCNGPSKGNPLWAIGHARRGDDTKIDAAYRRLWARFGESRDWPARLVGFGLDGVPICVPERTSGPTAPGDYYPTARRR